MIYIEIPWVPATIQNWVAAGIGLLTFGLLILIRWRIHTALRTTIPEKVTWRRKVLRLTSPISLIWCIWLGILAGLLFYSIPSQWAQMTSRGILTLTIAIGTYTLIITVIIFLEYFLKKVVANTKNRFDDVVVEVLKFLLPAIIGCMSIILILIIYGVDVTGVTSWLAQHGITISAIFFGGITLLFITEYLIPHFIKRSVVQFRIDETEEEVTKRAETLTGVVKSTAQIIIITGMILMILSELNINITTILAGVGVVGIAVGFGAQSLVKDVIAGLFIIFENQYRKGDVVKIADVSGLVEDINLRRTVLRDLDGIVHVVPNGEIRVTSNFTKIWSRVNINVSVSYNTDLDKAIAIINRIGQELAADPQWSATIITPPRFLRVDNFGDSGIGLKILGETKPLRQWEVMGELRLRLKKAFDKEGIEIPWPHIKMYFGEELKIKQK